MTRWASWTGVPLSLPCLHLAVTGIGSSNYVAQKGFKRWMDNSMRIEGRAIRSWWEGLEWFMDAGSHMHHRC